MINQATLIGRIGKKELRTQKNGKEYAMLSLATSKRFQGTDGQFQERTTWHTIFCYDKVAEIVKKYIEVGYLVYVAGEINHSKITSGNREGQWTYSVIANQIKVVNRQNKQSKQEPQSQDMAQHKEWLDAYNGKDDIPF